MITASPIEGQGGLKTRNSAAKIYHLCAKRRKKKSFLKRLTTKNCDRTFLKDIIRSKKLKS